MAIGYPESSKIYLREALESGMMDTFLFVDGNKDQDLFAGISAYIKFVPGSVDLDELIEYQKPHPPLIRACISEPSVAEMAKIGRPVLIGVQTVDTLRHRLELYRNTMNDAGFAESAVESALDQTWVQRGLVVADSDQEALDIAGPALERYRKHLLDARINYNVTEVPAMNPNQPRPAGEVVEQAFLAGTPRRVAEQVAELKDIGARNVMLNVNVGQIAPQHVERSLRLFGEQVMPKFRDG